MNDLAKSTGKKITIDRVTQQALYAASFQIIFFAALSAFSHALLEYQPGPEAPHPLWVVAFLIVSAGATQLAFFFSTVTKHSVVIRSLLYVLGVSAALAVFRMQRFEQAEAFSIELAILAPLAAAAFAATQARLLRPLEWKSDKWINSISNNALVQLSFFAALFGLRPAMIHPIAAAATWIVAIAVGTAILRYSPKHPLRKESV